MSEDGDEQPLHPSERLKKQAREAKEAKERQEKEVVHCPECETELLKDSVEEAIEAVDTHDEKRHGGKPTTRVNGIVPPQFSEEEKKQIRDAVRSLRARTEESQ